MFYLKNYINVKYLKYNNINKIFINIFINSHKLKFGFINFLLNNLQFLKII